VYGDYEACETRKDEDGTRKESDCEGCMGWWDVAGK
jgi:hypothetical protein